MPDGSPNATEITVENYVKTIYTHTEWQDAPITPSELAGKLGLAPSTVTEMVKKLSAAGLVTHIPYGAASLTDAGLARALAVVRRHRLVETWLVNQMGYSWDEVHDEAEVLEHVITDRLLEAIATRLGHPTHDPHGDPIPSADGAIPREPFVLLAKARAGHRGRVLRISDADPELLRTLAAIGIGVGVEVGVEAEVETGHAIEAAPAARLTVAGVSRTLPRAALSAIWISAHPAAGG